VLRLLGDQVDLIALSVGPLISSRVAYLNNEALARATLMDKHASAVIFDLIDRDVLNNDPVPCATLDDKEEISLRGRKHPIKVYLKWPPFTLCDLHGDL
jgi:hypothetical protein